MLLSQGISYWDAPELLHAQWIRTGTDGIANDGQQGMGQQGRGGHIPPSLHSSTLTANRGAARPVLPQRCPELQYGARGQEEPRCEFKKQKTN